MDCGQGCTLRLQSLAAAAGQLAAVGALLICMHTLTHADQQLAQTTCKGIRHPLHLRPGSMTSRPCSAASERALAGVLLVAETICNRPPALHHVIYTEIFIWGRRPQECRAGLGRRRQGGGTTALQLCSAELLMTPCAVPFCVLHAVRAAVSATFTVLRVYLLHRINHSIADGPRRL